MGFGESDGRILIDGRWIATSHTMTVRNPYTNKPVGIAGCATPDHIATATESLRRFRSDLTAYDRGEILFAAASRLDAQAADFASGIVDESGLCLNDARKEVARASANLRFAAEEAKRIEGESLKTDVTSARAQNLAFTVLEPLGVVCAITPFNRPLNQVVVKLAPAIASNNKIIIKPSEKTPLTARRFVELLIDCGLPPRMISLVTGRPEEIGAALVTSPSVDMVTFTGSADVGKAIAKSIGMIRSTFELGDSGALIVLADADLGQAAKAAAIGAYATAGQSCRGVKRILVQQSVADAFLARLIGETEPWVVGDPFDEATTIGTLISEAAAVEVERRVAEALEQGASLVCGGRRFGAQYWPTILDHVSPVASIVARETFGPCAPLVRIADLDEAISMINAGRFGLQTGIFTRDIELAMRAARRLQVGTVIVNGGPQFESPNIPFGGVKDSGIGREGVKYAMREMMAVKTIVL